jgi:Domain of unknown function DUF11
MAEFDDDRPGAGEPPPEPPGGETGGLRRFAPRRRRDEPEQPPDEPFADEPYADEAGTGEVPRASMRAASGPPPPDDDLGFDAFDDEPAPPPRSSRSARGSRGRRPRGSRPRRSGSRGGRGGDGRGGGGVAILQQPRARLALAIAFAAILILVITLVVRDCQRSQLEDSYTTYLNDVSAIVAQSAEQGKQLRQILNNPRGENPPQLSQRIRTLAGEASGLVDDAEGLDPPGQLSTPQRALVRTLEYRVNGMTSLAQNLPTLLQAQDEDTKAIGIADGMKRFLTSDVIYTDEFYEPAKDGLEEDDITGTEVPEPQPFLPNPALASPDGAASLIPALQRSGPAQGGDAEAGNLRGTSIVSTEALPSETRLTPGTAQAVQASDELKWRVTIENGGDFNETAIVVTASFFYPSDPQEVDEKQAQIDELAPGQTTTVEIAGPTTPVFGEQGTLRIEVDAVTGETNTDNNAAEYPVKITI